MEISKFYGDQGFLFSLWFSYFNKVSEIFENSKTTKFQKVLNEKSLLKYIDAENWINTDKIR